MSVLREGDRISNYLLEAKVGAGSFGEVWRARHHVFNDVVAIKIPTDLQYVRNLQREGIAVHGLRHDNIVRAIDLDPYAEPPYLVMEFVEGPSLRAAIDECKATFPLPAVLAIMQGLLEALGCAHENGVIHRDIKPANILLQHGLADLATIDPEAVKVTDFGLGHAGGLTTQSIMQSGSMLTDAGRSISGTLAYMAPEQKEGKPIDPRSDLYACGIILFEMLTGERPQGGDRPSSLRKDTPRHLDDVFERCYTRIERRFASAAEMLEAMAAGDAPKPPPVPAWVSAGARPRCPSCGSLAYRDDQFCIQCGQRLAAAVPRCSRCHAYVHSSDRFCIFCGNDLRVLTE